MSRFHSYLNSARQILSLYKGEEPFASFLKKFFAVHKKYGSKDRKQIAHLCYCYFRLGKATPAKEGQPDPQTTEEKLLLALFLCAGESNEILKEIKPGWNDKISLPLQEKYSILPSPFSVLNVFPWKEELSEGIDHEKFCESFFIQPDVFLRLRPGHESWVKEKLSKAGISFREVEENCLALPSASKIDQTLALNYEAVIQDLNSQKTADFFRPAIYHSPLPFIAAWDCCAGSGGKSIMLYDLHPQLDLTVSDIREGIILNLKKRFKEAEIKNYKPLVVDLSNDNSPRSSITNNQFSIIICDAPCTGSGTWGRTPEQLYFFDEHKINDYAARQKKIVANAIPHLGPQSSFIYITCSVFKKENEEVVEFIRRQFNLDLVKMEILRGYDKKADTMFAALLRKPL